MSQNREREGSGRNCATIGLRERAVGWRESGEPCRSLRGDCGFISFWIHWGRPRIAFPPFPLFACHFFMPDSRPNEQEVKTPRPVNMEESARAWRLDARMAIARDDTAALARLRPAITAHCLIDSAISLASGAKDAEPALMFAVRSKSLDAVKWLIEKAVQDNADVSNIASASANDPGWTALMEAVARGNKAIVEALLPVSAVNQVDNNGDSALIWAVKRQESAIVSEMLKFCDAKQRGASQSTALMHATTTLSLETFRELLAKSDALAKNDQGDTALTWAAYWLSAEVVEALLPFSDTRAKTNAGRTAFEEAWLHNAEDDENLWKTLDLLAETGPEDVVAQAFEKGGAKKMPWWAAKLEADELAAVVVNATGPNPPNFQKVGGAMAAGAMPQDSRRSSAHARL